MSKDDSGVSFTPGDSFEYFTQPSHEEAIKIAREKRLAMIKTAVIKDNAVIDLEDRYKYVETFQIGKIVKTIYSITITEDNSEYVSKVYMFIQGDGWKEISGQRTQTGISDLSEEQLREQIKELRDDTLEYLVLMVTGE